MQISYKVAMVILAFFAAVVVTKTISKYFKLDQKANKEDENNEEDKE